MLHEQVCMCSSTGVDCLHGRPSRGRAGLTAAACWATCARRASALRHSCSVCSISLSGLSPQVREHSAILVVSTKPWSLWSVTLHLKQCIPSYLLSCDNFMYGQHR